MIRTSLKILLLLILLACEGKETKKESIGATEKEVAKKENSAINDIKSRIKDLDSKGERTFLYVCKNTGIAYRKSPQGEILGYLPLNTKLEVLERTSIFGQIADGNETLKGEWVGIVKGEEIVYVLDTFLSKTYTFSKTKIYKASQYLKKENGTISTGFLNVSDAYFSNKDATINLLQKEDLKDTITLNLKQREKFLNTIKVSETDNVFIYDVNNEKVHKYQVKSLPIIACIKPYFDANHYEKKEKEFQFGFDLQDKLKYNCHINFAYIGEKNPFETGMLKPFVWKRLKTTVFEKELVTYGITETLKNEVKFVLSYESETLQYYLLNKNKLVVIDKKEKEIIFNHIFYSGVNASLTLPILENEREFFFNQWTGKLFKNMPPIVFGFQNWDFGCEKIRFLNKSEPPILVFCDNRQ